MDTDNDCFSFSALPLLLDCNRVTNWRVNDFDKIAVLTWHYLVTSYQFHKISGMRHRKENLTTFLLLLETNET